MAVELDSNSNGYVDIEKGGTNAGDAATARENLGVIDYETAANLGDVSHAINTTGKFIGKMVWDSTNLRPLWAETAAAAGVWIDGVGATQISPS